MVLYQKIKWEIMFKPEILSVLSINKHFFKIHKILVTKVNAFKILNPSILIRLSVCLE